MDEYAVNIDYILESDETYSQVRKLFRQLKERGYVTPKQYFESISDSDAFTLMNMVEESVNSIHGSDVQFAMTEQLMLLTIGFLLGEGSEINEQNVTEGSNAVFLMITIDSLARKGLVEAYRDKWCLNGGYPTDVWVKKID